MRRLNSVSGNLEFQAHHGLEGLELLSSAWGALAESIPGAKFMHFPEWYRAYLASGASGAEHVWFVAAYRGGELVAVFPLQHQYFRFGGLPAVVLGTIDEDEMQRSDFVFAPSLENQFMLQSLVSWLRGQQQVRWDELRLRNVSDDSSIAHAARACAPRWTVSLLHDNSNHFDVSDSFDRATQSVSGSFKRNLRRLTKRAESQAPLRFRSYRQADEIAEGFNTFIDIEGSGWKGGASTAIRCQPQMLAFYRGLCEQFGASQRCVINVLRYGDQVAAAQFCLQVGKTLHILKVGFNEAHAKIAPGNLLLEETLRRACADATLNVVSLVNAPAWARNFKPFVQGVRSYCAPNLTARGAIVHFGLLAKRARDRLVTKHTHDDRDKDKDDEHPAASTELAME